jgi:hypothetical protein
MQFDEFDSRRKLVSAESHGIQAPFVIAGTASLARFPLSANNIFRRSCSFPVGLDTIRVGRFNKKQPGYVGRLVTE